ncbi:hypothetical protein [Xenorhabdus thuongxuanensis]|uniref:HphA C-terminal domain-containing protein n=1 Tax=Xenorhabdus thuongxuanensis TaxID=1873484 RepID=A0A1Q5U6K0_9GAMM|nr:hypothetical protein [Xenorhabdus thuongxuanensis]OKP08111.1 hypothetical protein Xentx_00809 [Xenorhabdus thuongxuanensis]
MKKLNILIAMLGVVGFITQAQAKISDSISQQETNPHFLFEKEKGEIYFGEWAQKTPDTSEITHTVFNAGTEVTTKLPDSGIAIYTVKGTIDAHSRNFLSGKLTANFDSKKLIGSMNNSSLTIGIDANIKDNGEFSGKATANGIIDREYYEKINGVSNGNFIELPHISPSLSGRATFDKEGKIAIFSGTKQ